MRATIVILLLPLAACGGGGVGSAGSLSAGSGSTASTTTPTTTTPTTTTTTTTTPATTTPTTTTTATSSMTTTATPAAYTAGQVNMFDVTTATTFSAVGAMHSLALNNGSSLYRGNASTVAAPSGQITYDPRDGIFNLTLSDTKAGINRTITFQDPAHRTTTDAPDVDRQVPLLAGFNYLNVLDSTDGKTTLTFFYQRPNSAASFVSLAGVERNQQNSDGTSLSEQGVLVFGAPTTVSEIPTSGAAHFDGLFLATMIEQQANSDSVQQWLNGTSAVDVDFAKRTLSLTLAGSVGPAFVKNAAVADSNLAIPSGSTFAATGSASWTGTVNAFAGKFATAGFTNGQTSIPIDFTSVSAGTASAGASSIDGAFYGPATKNIGGNFRIVGGIPNQRVDILGGFVGAKR